MRLERTDEWVTKVAESDDDRRRLAREAAVLRSVAHPAVVRVAGLEGPGAPDHPDRLRLHRVAGPSLAEIPIPSEQVAAGWGAAVATVVADLHDLGFRHGSLSAEHVLIDEHGRPVLCGFAHAGRLGEVGRAAADEDVQALARLVSQLLGPGRDRLRRLVRKWEGARRRPRSGARGLARALVEKVPDATVAPADSLTAAGTGDPRDGGTEPVPEPASPPRHRRAPAWKLVAGTAGVAVAFGCGLFVSGATRTAPDRGSSQGYVMRSAPGEHPITVVGRWDCGPSGPVVLDTGSGSIWMFPAWPTGGATARGRFLDQVPGASGLAAVTDARGCDELVVLRSGQPDLPLVLGRAR